MNTRYHHIAACSVCGESVVFEAGAPRTYEVASFNPHYCDTATVSARLTAAQEAYVNQPESVEEGMEWVGLPAVVGEAVRYEERPVASTGFEGVALP